MADRVMVHGFGTEKRPWIERPPMERAEFEFPADATFHNMTIGEDYVEVTFRIPLPKEGQQWLTKP